MSGYRLPLLLTFGFESYQRLCPSGKLNTADCVGGLGPSVSNPWKVEAEIPLTSEATLARAAMSVSVAACFPFGLRLAANL